ncbi:MAG: leucine-rich repeat protein [Ruminococcus sp.]|nr:leucine-rich repeat protein [Ruminococcus sp.]
MTIRDLTEMECTSCKSAIFVDKNADYWYCGYCGKRIDIKTSAELQEKENRLKAKESELKIRENALKSKEAQLKAKEAELKALETGEALPVRPSAPQPTFKVNQSADGTVVPKLNRPDTVLNNPEMKFTNLASEANKKPKQAESETKSEKKIQPETAEQVKKPELPKKPEPPKTAETPKNSEPENNTATVQHMPDIEQHKSEPEKKEEEPIIKKKVKISPKTENGKPKEFEMNEHTLVKYNGTIAKVYLPGNVWRIGSGAFKDNKNITSVVCGDNIKEIGDSAFAGCTELAEVKLSNELRRINYKTFNGCEKLKSIEIPDSVQEIMHDSMVCGLEEIILNSPRTTWEQPSDFADASFSVDKNDNGKGVRRIIFRGTTYKAVDVFRHGNLANYFKSNKLCQYCGSKFSIVNGKCPNCKIKKDY